MTFRRCASPPPCWSSLRSGRGSPDLRDRRGGGYSDGEGTPGFVVDRAAAGRGGAVPDVAVG